MSGGYPWRCWIVAATATASPCAWSEGTPPTLFGLSYYSEGLVVLAAVPVACVAALYAAYRYEQGAWSSLGRAVTGGTVWVLAAVATWLVVINGEVLYVSARANLLCRTEAGVRVARSVAVDTIADPFVNVEFWHRLGVNFVEYSRFDRALGRRVNMRAELVDGEPVHYAVDRHEARYTVGHTGAVAHGHGIVRSSSFVRALVTGETLGEFVRYSIRRGWFEQYAWPPYWGDDRPRWTCGDEAPEGEGMKDIYSRHWLYTERDLYKAVVRPRTRVRPLMEQGGIRTRE